MKIIVKGEGPGHPFRGNQYSGGAQGVAGGKLASAPKAPRSVDAKTRRKLANQIREIADNEGNWDLKRSIEMWKKKNPKEELPEGMEEYLIGKFMDWYGSY